MAARGLRHVHELVDWFDRTPIYTTYLTCTDILTDG